MVYIVPNNPDTREDQRLYTRARLVDVMCGECHARVGVKKNSEHHTSIQWSVEAVSRCVEFDRLDDEPGGRKIYAACPRLVTSIESAVLEGAVQIGAEDGY